MLFETASHELPLLIFTLLVPMGLAGSSLVFLARGLGGESRSSKKLDTLGVVPVAFLVVGLIASFFHLGSPQRAFGMVGGLGTSPLSNEIVVAGASIAVAVVLWIVSVAKHPEGKIQLYFGVMMGVLALASAVFTGLAYAIPTIIVWNSPCGWISQVFLALAGGASIAALVLSIAGENGSTIGKIVSACAIVGAVGAAITVLAQGAIAADALSSAGTTLASAMGSYWTCAVIGAILACVAAALVAVGFVKSSSPKPAAAAIALVASVAAFALIRVCFYGTYLTVGLA